MKKQIRFKESNKYVDWLASHPEFDKASSLPALPQAQELLNHLWPLSISYWNPLNSIFLFQFMNLEFLKQRETWFVRDGLIPLLYFFRTYPKPGNLKSKLYVEEDLAGLVPPAWQKNFGTYKIISKSSAAHHAQKLLVCGIASAIYCQVEDIQSQLTGQNVKRWQEMEKFIFMPVRGSQSTSDQNYQFNLYRSLFASLGSDWKSLNWHQIDLKDSFADHELLVLCNNLLCADTYFVHAALSKGAYLNSKSAFKDGRYLPLSPSHGALIQESIPRSVRNRLHGKTGLELQEYLIEHLNTPANKDLPWPELFKQWESHSS